MTSALTVRDNSPEAPVAKLSPSAYRKRQSRRDRRSKKNQQAIVGNMACPSCRAKGGDSTGNHLMLFEDGSGYCNRCPKKFNKEQVEDAKNGTSFDPKNPHKYRGSYQFNSRRGGGKYEPELTMEDMLHLGYLGDPKRKIHPTTDEHFGIKTKIDPTNRKHLSRYYPYRIDNELYGYKTRNLPKDWGNAIGTIKGADLFGWHLCTGRRRTLIITEGEEDTAAGWQMHKAMNRRSSSGRINRANPHIVSLPDGAKGVVKALMHHIEELEKYDKYIWMGDNYKTDEDGSKAMELAVQVLGVDKFHVAEYPEHRKDLCDILKLHSTEEAIDIYSEMYFGAKPYTPADVVDGSDLTLEAIEKEPIIGLPICFPSLEKKLRGMRLFEHTLLVSGSGMGKSTYTRAIGHWMKTEYDWPVGNIYLEEKNAKTQQGYIAYDNKVALDIYRRDFNCIPREDKQKTMDNVISDMMFLNHNGKIDTDVLMNKIRYMYNKGCKLIILDHISLAVSGSDNERTDLDYLMETLYRFCEHHPVHILSVVHLNRGPSGSKDVTRGGEITPRHLLGSSGLVQMIWNLICLEGDNQHPELANMRYMRVLKTREGGKVGPCEGGYEYNPETGRVKYHPDATVDDVNGSKPFEPPKPEMGGKSAGKYDNKAS